MQSRVATKQIEMVTGRIKKVNINTSIYCFGNKCALFCRRTKNVKQCAYTNDIVYVSFD